MVTAYLRANRAYLGWAIASALALTAAMLVVLYDVAHRFGVMGVEHILLGYDHLAFLVMLMIAVRTFKDLVLVITTFTLAHSITLTAATLGWVIASPVWVEPLIAFTILYVAVENLLTEQPRGRLLFAFGFGLIHGLGFASALAEGPLPRAQELIALFSFNLGVEVGQILFLSLTYPLWAWLRQQPYGPRARQAVALAVALLCVYWLWERL